MQINKQEKSPIKQRILQYIENKGISKYQFYKETGITRGILDQFNGLSEDSLSKFIAYAQDISLPWLMIGQGDMIATVQDNIQVEPLSNTVDRNIENQLIPMYDSEVAAGFSMILNSDVVPSDYISIPNLPVCDGAVLVRGESMSPKLRSGDIVIYKMINNPQRIIWNDIYIVSFMTDGDFYTVIKTIKKGQTNGFIQLASINPEHEPFEIPIDSIQQLAQVRASIQYYTM